MPKLSPIPDDVDRPHQEGANEDRLVLQYCTTDNEWHYPPKAVCPTCESAEHLEWRENDGAGTIYSYAVIHHSYIDQLKADLPYNAAVIQLDSAPELNFFTRLPGSEPGDVPIGAKVKVVFESTPGTGQKVPEWVLVES
jgi:uncharacterized OB-fold protein